MRVLKFGGTSLGSREAISKVLSIILKRINNNEKILVVVSAFSGITDQLIELSNSNQSKKSHDILYSIKNRHVNVIKSLFTNTEQPNVLKKFDNLFQELDSSLHFNSQNQHELKRNQDYIIGFGERFSAQIITSCLKKHNINALYTDTRKLIKTNEDYGFAKIKKDLTYNNISDFYQKHLDHVIIATGFIASTVNGFPTTLGRGGSDYTASIFGAATQADAVEIWTDVDGLMTADPYKVKSAISIAQISYRNAKQFSKYGAKVIYPPTIEPAMKYDIPIYIKNTFNPEKDGTLINNKPINLSEKVLGISSFSHICLITIKSKNIKYVRNTLIKRCSDENLGIKIIEHSMVNNFAKIAFTSQNLSISVSKIDHIIQKELVNLIDHFEIYQDLSMITIVGKHPAIISAKSLNIFDNAVKSTIYNKKLKSLSVFIERMHENQLLNNLHDILITNEEPVNT